MTAQLLTRPSCFRENITECSDDSMTTMLLSATTSPVLKRLLVLATWLGKPLESFHVAPCLIETGLNLHLAFSVVTPRWPINSKHWEMIGGERGAAALGSVAELQVTSTSENGNLQHTIKRAASGFPRASCALWEIQLAKNRRVPIPTGDNI